MDDDIKPHIIGITESWVQISYSTYNSYHWSSISLSQHNQTKQRKNT